MRSLCSQLRFSYASLKQTPSPPKLAFTSLADPITSIIDSLYPEYTRWKIDIHTQHYTELYKEESIVYLTADSDNVITDLVLGTTYIVGGLVDHNTFPRLCLSKAVENGVKNGRLPIDDYVKMKGRKVLTVNNIVEIMVRYCECRDWGVAFLGCIPDRKLEIQTKEKKDHVA